MVVAEFRSQIMYDFLSWLYRILKSRNNAAFLLENSSRKVTFFIASKTP